MISKASATLSSLARPCDGSRSLLVQGHRGSPSQDSAEAREGHPGPKEWPWWRNLVPVTSGKAPVGHPSTLLPSKPRIPSSKTPAHQVLCSASLKNF